jgi:hypothetical protein
MGVLYVFPSHVWVVVWVGFLVWACFWVVLGWVEGLGVCWMGWDRMGDLLWAKKNRKKNVYIELLGVVDIANDNY